MARNEEKAQSMLYRFRKAMQAEQEGWVNPSPNEPLIPSTCESLPAALYARKELLKDVSRKLSRIHDPTLPPPTIRSLNDDLNRQIRRIHEWNARLVELGHQETDKTIRWGDEVLPEPGNVHGYLYFGRAKELPGVEELLKPKREEKTRLPARIIEMERRADGEYFGIGEGVEEEEERRKAEGEAERTLCTATVPLTDWITGLPVLLPPIEVLPSPPPLPPIPTASQVEQFLIDKRRESLLRRFAS